jgi:hypothetical protein
VIRFTWKFRLKSLQSLSMQWRSQRSGICDSRMGSKSAVFECWEAHTDKITGPHILFLAAEWLSYMVIRCNIKKFGRVDLDCHQWTKPAKLLATLRCSGLCLNLAWIKTPKEMPLHIYTFSVAMSSPVANSALMMLQQVFEIKMTYLNAFRATNGPRWKLKASRPDEKSSQRIRNTFRKRHLQIFQHSTAHKSKDFKRIHHHFPSDFPICRRTPCRLRACEVWNGKRSPS